MSDAFETCNQIYDIDIGYKVVSKRVDDYYSGGGS